MTDADRRCCSPTFESSPAPAPSAARSPGGPAAGGPAASAKVRLEGCEIPGGRFLMGNDGPDAVPGDGEGPVREIAVEPFAIGAATVTNAEFAAFVRATRYVTEAERHGGSFVFYLQVPAAERAASTQVVAGLPWWLPVAHASWQRPEGPGSHVHERMGLPVVHVTWDDAHAYCAWAGARLPTEAEWERAARGGLEGRRFAWGDDLLDAAGEPRCNVFRGAFPNAPAPGWLPAPVDARSGEPNGYGLYNTCGNVWEWCADAFDEIDPTRRALRGGSYLCHDSYCNRYRVAARSSNTRDTSTSNIGFRVVALRGSG